MSKITGGKKTGMATSTGPGRQTSARANRLVTEAADLGNKLDPELAEELAEALEDLHSGRVSETFRSIEDFRNSLERR